MNAMRSKLATTKTAASGSNRNPKVRDEELVLARASAGNERKALSLAGTPASRGWPTGKQTPPIELPSVQRMALRRSLNASRFRRP